MSAWGFVGSRINGDVVALLVFFVSMGITMTVHLISRFSVIFIEERPHLTIAARCNVMRQTGNDEAGEASHAAC